MKIFESIFTYLSVHPKLYFWLGVFVDVFYDFIKTVLLLLLVYFVVYSAGVALLMLFLDIAQDAGLFVLLEQALMGVIG